MKSRVQVLRTMFGRQNPNHAYLRRFAHGGTSAGRMAGEDRSCHADRRDSTLMGADVLPEQYERPKGFHVLVGVDDPAEAERVFEALLENGRTPMPLQQTFWGSIRRVVGD